MQPMLEPSDPATAPAELQVEPCGVCLPVATGQSLLEAADRAGLRLPRSCRNGTCRACLAHLLEGKVRWRVDWPGVSAEERSQGWVLPCVAEAATARLRLHAPGARALLSPGPPAAP
jgi:ferredoxin